MSTQEARDELFARVESKVSKEIAAFVKNKEEEAKEECDEKAKANGGRSLFTFMSGIDCGYRDYSVVSLTKDGTVIYQDGRWTDGWATRTLRLSVSEYLATTSRVDNYTGMENPLLQWNGTPRLLSNNLVDNENAVLVLRKEAAASGGRLYIDASAHYILQ